MLNIDISFRNQDALTQFVVPQLIGKPCMHSVGIMLFFSESVKVALSGQVQVR